MTSISGPPRFARAAGRLARAVVMLYPPAFRRALGDDLVAAFRDRVEAAAERGRIPAAWALSRGILDLAVAAALEWLHPTLIPEPGASAGAGRVTGALMDHLAQDLRFAFRSLVRRPGFAAVAILTLALGVGATTGVFSVINGVLLQPLPYPDPSGLVMVWASDADGPPSRGYMSQPDIESVQAVKGLAGVEGVASGSVTLTGVDHPELVNGARVTGGVLSIFGLAPVLGRDLREDENDPGAGRVVLVGYGFWKSHLGGRPDVVGTTLELAERRYEIVGVAPKGFDFPGGAELWRPYRLPLEGCGRGCHVYRGAVGRLAPGASFGQAQQALGALAAALGSEFPDSNFGQTFRLERLIDYTVGDVRTGLWIVLGAVTLVLLIVCANIANLLLVRASARSGEVAVRSALGASRGRLVLQVLTESLFLAGVGGVLGVLIAYGVVGGLGRLAPGAIPRLDDVAVNGTVLAFAAALTLLVSLIFGLSPAIRLARTSVAGEVHAAGRSGHGRREGRARSWLLGSEVALSVALLVGAGLLMRSLGRLYGVDAGFDGRHVARFAVSLPSRYDSLSTIVNFFDDLEARLEAIPGVEAVGSTYGAPLGRGDIDGEVLIDGRPEPPRGQETYASMRPMTPGYFDAMGLTLLRGRALTAADRGGTEPVAVVNETFVRENFPNEEVLGKRFRVTAGFGYTETHPTWTVVGVVHDERHTLAESASAAVYVPLAQFGPGFLTVHIKARGDAARVLPAARRALAAVDPDIVPTNVETVVQAMKDDAAPTRFYLMLVGVFAGLAVLLAAIGLYGVVAYLVSRRTREIGVRIALGARRAGITGLVFRQAALPTVVGVIVGLGIALAGGRVMKSLLFQIQPTDPVVFVGVTGLILGVCTVAVLLPARRASRVDPVIALRAE